jgi:hypothetical protein
MHGLLAECTLQLISKVSSYCFLAAMLRAEWICYHWLEFRVVMLRFQSNHVVDVKFSFVLHYSD